MELTDRTVGNEREKRERKSVQETTVYGTWNFQIER